MLDSFYYPLCSVEFPEYQGRQHYMHKFDLTGPTMPDGFEDYIPMVQQMCIAARVREPVFVTIDEKIVQPGMSQRRPGPHVDGCFMPEPKPESKGLYGVDIPYPVGSWAHRNMNPEQYAPGGGYWGHGGSRPGGGWNHYCNAVPFKRMPVITVATVPGCRVWQGQFDAEPQNDGDLSHIWDQLGEGVILPANIAYLLSPDCIHESMIFDQPTQRQFIRLALPVNTPI